MTYCDLNALKCALSQGSCILCKNFYRSLHLRKSMPNTIDYLPDKFYGIQLAAMIIPSVPDKGILLGCLSTLILSHEGLNQYYIEARCSQNYRRRVRNQVKKLQAVGLLTLENYRPEGSIVDHILIKRTFKLENRV